MLRDIGVEKLVVPPRLSILMGHCVAMVALVSLMMKCGSLIIAVNNAQALSMARAGWKQEYLPGPQMIPTVAIKGLIPPAATGRLIDQIQGVTTSGRCITLVEMELI